MTLDYYKLKEQPFGSIPDSRFLFVGSAHRQALGSVLLALQMGNGSVSLVAQPGLGKTTMLFHVLNTLKENVTTVYIFQAPQTPVELLRAILSDLGELEINEHPAEMLALLQSLLIEQLEQQKRVVVVIDEAQNLTPAVLQVVHTLSNAASDRGRPLQFILSGQSQLAPALAPANGAHLSYRAPVVATLEPLNAEDTALYVDHRLRIAGYAREAPLFTHEASNLIARYSEGVPRKINNLCYSSLALGYKTKRSTIDADIVRAVVADLGLDRTLQAAGFTSMRAPGIPAPPKVVSMPMPAHDRADLIVAKPPSPPAPPQLVEVPRRVSAFVEEPAEVFLKPPAEVRENVVPITPAAASLTSNRGRAIAPDLPEVLPFTAKARNTSSLAPKLGLVAAVLLAATVTLVNLNRHPAVRPPTAAVPVIPAPSPVSPFKALPQPQPSAKSAPTLPGPSPSPSQAALTAPPANAPDLKGMNLLAAVHALSGRSLKTICKENFGQCDSKQLQEMHHVNPRLAGAAQKHLSQNSGSSTRKVTATATDRPDGAPLASSN